MNVSPTTSRRALTACVAISAAALLAAGCSSSSGDSPKAPSSAPAALPGTASTTIGDLRITGGYIPQPASPDVAAAYFTVDNEGGSADTLVSVKTDVAPSVMAMTETSQGTTGSMTDVTRVSIPAHGSFEFTRGHAHLMLEKPTQKLVNGDKVSMTITFARAGAVTLAMPVVPLTGPQQDDDPMGGMSGMSHHH